jgi:SAM-dependent methyltransferase
MTDIALEPGSFRDRTARVFYHQGKIFRGLSDSAHKEWQALSATDFFRRFTANGGIVPTHQTDLSSLPLSSSDQQWAAVIEHERIPFVSYPYEWSFQMLRDAALLQLDLLLAALDEGMSLKDASAYNVQWRGAAPVFVDLASFHSRRPGEPWLGYRQFCQMFLYPLLLQAYRGIPFQPWLRGSLDGIDADVCLSMLSARDYLRSGVLAHVVLQARAQRAYASTTRDVRAELRAAGFDSRVIKANATRLRALVAGLTWNAEPSTWSDYIDCGHYAPADMTQKREFVRAASGAREWHLAWDLGCNVGIFSRIVAERAKQVVAMDADQLAVDRLYRALSAEGGRTILPLVVNLTDPSPDLGWRNLERKRLVSRGRPDLVLCLALIHHVVIGANIPLAEFLEWLRSLGAHLIIEFVTRDDPMVKTLLRNKEDQYADYQLEVFERELAARFTVEKRQPLGSGTRIMYFASPSGLSGRGDD